mgnify:CR=1 FL=1
MSLLDKIFSDISSSSTKEKNEQEDSISLIDSVIHNYIRKQFIDSNMDFETQNDSDFGVLWDEDELLFDLEEDSTENKLNKVRKTILDKKITREFISLLRYEDFEFGYKTRSETFLEEQLQINELATRNWLNELFIKNYTDDTITIGILRIIGRFEPSIIFPQGQTIALAALTHKNDEIKELGIRAFEHWCSPESLEILKTMDIQAQWLKEYRDDVIADFEEQLCPY